MFLVKKGRVQMWSRWEWLRNGQGRGEGAGVDGHAAVDEQPRQALAISLPATAAQDPEFHHPSVKVPL